MAEGQQSELDEKAARRARLRRQRLAQILKQVNGTYPVSLERAAPVAARSSSSTGAEDSTPQKRRSKRERRQERRKGKAT